jgi:hypothetical protein
MAIVQLVVFPAPLGELVPSVPLEDEPLSLVDEPLEGLPLELLPLDGLPLELLPDPPLLDPDWGVVKEQYSPTHVAPCALHLQSVFTVHQPSIPGDCPAFAQVIFAVYEHTCVPQPVPRDLQSMSFVQLSARADVLHARAGAVTKKAARTKALYFIILISLPAVPQTAY